jgi:ribonuclease D
MIPYDYIQTDAGLSAMVSKLRAARRTRLAIDVEGENNLHRYGIHVALIQLYDGERGYVVDALSLGDKRLLEPLLVDAPWVLVWFDAANDLLSFQHALGIRPSPILDLAVAARLLGKKGGLHALTPRQGSASAKDRFQKSNWMRRPLPRALLDYAVSDVVDLLPLADELLAELEDEGLMAEFTQRNLAAQNAARSWNPLANFVRIPGYKRLPREGSRFGRLLWYARELYAQQHDQPTVNVASKEEIRRILDKGLRTSAEVARFLNEDRRRNRIDPSELETCFSEARALIDADDARGHPGDPRPH